MAIKRIKGPAPIIRAAVATLQSELPAHIAAFNADGVNAVDLDDLVAVIFGATDERLGYPYAEVAILDGTFGPFSTGEVGVGDADHTPRLQVVVWLEGGSGDAPKLYEQGIGYAVAVIEILAQDGALGVEAEVSGTREDAIRYRFEGPIPSDMTSQDRAFWKWRYPVVVELVVEAVDHWA